VDHKDVGRRVRALREQAGLTLLEVADKIGLSQGQMSRLENGHQAFRSAILLQLAEVLGVRPIEFFVEDASHRAKIPGHVSQRLANALREPDFVKLAGTLAEAYRELPEQFHAINTVAQAVVGATRDRAEKAGRPDAAPPSLPSVGA
jgi:transcriptional regulator with XRE-family HTH domain